MGLGNLLLIPGIGSSVAPLDIKASVGTSTSPFVTGTKAVTGVGFEPKVVMPFGGPSSSQGSGLGAILGLGAGKSSSSRASICVSSISSATTSNTNRRHDDTKVFTTLDGTGNVLEAADLSSLDADGFTFNWTTANADARILNHICLGGADLEVSLTQHQMNNTNAAQSFAHGLSGAPTGLFVFSAQNGNAPPNTDVTSAMSIGAWSSSGQWVSNVWSNNGQTTTATRRTLADTAICRFNTGATNTIIRALTVDSVNATNVNCSYSVTTSTAQAYFWMLAIRGAKCQTGTFDCNGSLSPLTISTPGITPKLFLPVFVPIGVDSINTILNSAQLAIGASDGTNNVSCGITDVNGVTTTNARRYQTSNSLSEYDSAGGVASAMTAGFSGESVVITPTTLINSLYGQGCYFVVGS